jgi:hypothetical protein
MIVAVIYIALIVMVQVSNAKHILTSACLKFLTPVRNSFGYPRVHFFEDFVHAAYMFSSHTMRVLPSRTMSRELFYSVNLSRQLALKAERRSKSICVLA